MAQVMMQEQNERQLENTVKVNKQGANEAGTIEATVQERKIFISEAIIQEVLRLGDQPQHPTSYDQNEVVSALRRMSYEGGYPIVLKKLFPPYWRLLLNKTLTCALLALVNEWDYNFSAFIFDHLKKMLEDPKRKIFMLYPRFIQMILDEKHPELVKVPNYINLKPIGPGCFENAYRAKRAKQHNFVGKFDLEKYSRFGDVVPAVLVAPAPQQINVQVAEEHDMQQVQQVVANEAEVETEILDSDSETDSSEEETDSESKVEIVAYEKEEEAVRQPVPMSSEDLAALLMSLQGGDGNPPTVRTFVVQNEAADT
ncbi:hypothetical protein Hanom_Chr09g00779281 [Helianthus anomalus]